MDVSFRLFGKEVLGLSGGSKRESRARVAPFSLTDPDSIFAQPTAARVNVTPKSAMALSAVFRCYSLFSTSVGMLPLKINTRTPEGAIVPFEDSPVYDLIVNNASASMAAAVWRETMTMHALGWGNGYSVIRRDGNGYPTKLDLIKEPGNTIIVEEQGELFYIFPELKGDDRLHNAADVFHLMDLSLDGVKGMNRILTLREAVGGAMGAQNYANSIFGTGGAKRVALVYPPGQKVDDDVEERMLDTWKEKYGSGEAHKAGRPATLRAGMDVREIGMDPDAAQLLESRKFSVSEIGRIFGVPLHKLGLTEGQSNKGIEQAAREWLDDGLMPWLTKFEREVNRKLLVPVKGKKGFAKFNVSAMLRGDSAARMNQYRQLYYLGAMNANEIREKEDMPPVDMGDRYMMQQNLIPADMVEEAQKAKNAKYAGSAGEGTEGKSNEKE